MSTCDSAGKINEMESHDFLKVAGGAAAGVGLIAALPLFGAIGTVTVGGAILGSLLGAGAGMAVVSEDEENRGLIRQQEHFKREQDWSQSIAARQSLADSANSMEGYLQAVKLIYALAASSTLKDKPEDANLIRVKNELDGIFAIWLPRDVKEELTLLYQKTPAFYDVGLMIRESFKAGVLDGASFMDSAESMLSYLDYKGVISRRNIDEEWAAFKVGLITESSTKDKPKKK